nr:hypothetical protein [Staphylococcus warneri]
MKLTKLIQHLLFSHLTTYQIYVNTRLNQAIIPDIKHGYLTIHSIPYIHPQTLYYYPLQPKTLLTN